MISPDSLRSKIPDGIESAEVKKFRLPDHPWISAIAVLFLYALVEGLSEAIIGLSWTDHTLLRILLKFAAFGFLCFFVIPVVFRIPHGSRSIRGYLSEIRLSRADPFGGIIFVSLSCYLIFVLSQLTGSVLYYSNHPGRYILDLSRNSLLEPRTLTSGFFEEVIFRGVLIALFLRRYRERRAVIFSALLFAGIHLLNALNPEIPTAWALAQVVWALGLGILYGHMFITTDSLWSQILLHYMLNGFVGVWFRGLDTMDQTSALYGIPFFGLIPAALSIFWVAFLYRRWLRKKRS